MKQFAALTLVLVILFGMSACSLITKIPGLPESASEEEQVLKPVETPQATETPEPSPTPSIKYITAYEELKDGDRAELEFQIEKWIGKQAKKLYEENKFQPYGIYGMQLPLIENYAGADMSLDSVCVFSASDEDIGFKNRIVMLYEMVLHFTADPIDNKSTLYLAVSLDDVYVGEDGKAEFEVQNASIDTVLSPNTYSFYDLCEEAVLIHENTYHTQYTICDEMHDTRMEEIASIDRWLESEERIQNLEKTRAYAVENMSDYPEKYRPLPDGYEVIIYSSDRKLIQADIRGLSANDLQIAIAEIYARNGGNVEMEDFDPSVFSEIEQYNLDFFKSRMEKIPVVEISPTPSIEPTSAPSAEPTPNPTEEPIQQDSSGFTGTWKVDTQKTNAMNDEAILFHFGSMIKQSSMEMTVGESGFFAFGLGAAGGEGTYTIEDGKLIARYMPYNGQQEVTMSIDKVVEEGIEYLLMTMETDGYLVYWKKQ